MSQVSGSALFSQPSPVACNDRQSQSERRDFCSEGRQDLYVHEWISAQADATPNAVAVTQGKTSLTYQELNRRADQVAGLLQAHGVGPDVVVAIYLNRSPAMIVAALGVLKAGGAYLPLDPAYPAERLATMLNDANAPVLVTGRCMLASLPACPKHAISLDAEGRCESGDRSDLRPVQSHADHLAYLIYTSGSTGQPKGVELTHAGLLNLVRWHHCAFQVTASDRACQLAALGFDAAVWEIWPYLSAGAHILLPESLAVNEPEAVRDWLIAHEITICFLATPLAERMLILEWPGKTKAALRVMLTGADTLHHYPPSKLKFQLVNNYGPTECTVVATSGLVLPSEHADTLPTIGKPIDNVQIHILDDRRQEVPVGEPGEIHIGGLGVGRGYRNRPDLTEERFIVSPFNTHQRLYKTGDLGRRLPDGQIAFLGRIDEQIKIRGFRIEPAEIVKVLDEHPQVGASAVVARKTVTGDSQLVAYLVPAGPVQPLHTELRNFIAGRLPAHMVPATFVKLAALPLTASGKVDRAALAAPNLENTLRDNEFVAPRTPIEDRVASMLSPLLGLDRVSMEDNFFLLGGHSLLGTQLIARVRDAFGIELTLRSLFDAPTVARLASQIETQLMARLESMSDADAERLLAEMTGAKA